MEWKEKHIKKEGCQSGRGERFVLGWGLAPPRAQDSRIAHAGCCPHLQQPVHPYVRRRRCGFAGTSAVAMCRVWRMGMGVQTEGTGSRVGLGVLQRSWTPLVLGDAAVAALVASKHISSMGIGWFGPGLSVEEGALGLLPRYCRLPPGYRVHLDSWSTIGTGTGIATIFTGRCRRVTHTWLWRWDGVSLKLERLDP